MAQIIDYMAHDPVANAEGQLTDYTKETLIDAEAHGIVFIAVYDDGTRAVVRAADITPPSAAGGQDFVFVAPVYVDQRHAATVECFSALAEIVNPAAATVSEDGTETAQQADSVAKFMAALEALKAFEPASGDVE